MKKRKFNILLNIAVLCMCVCAIAIGVYSAKTASLNVSGTIGFQAHNCKVRVLGQITGTVDVSNNAITSNTDTATINYTDSSDTSKGKLIDGTSDTWKVGALYFDDLNTDKYHQVNDICFTFEITNMSAYYVDVTVDQNCINNDRIFIYAPNNGETLAPKDQTGSSVTLTVKFQLQKVNGEYSSLDSAISLSNATLLNFEKSQAPAYLATDWKTQIESAFTIDMSTSSATTTKISFVREINDTILNGFDTNDGTYKSVSVGAVNETSTAGNLTENVSDVVAYYNSNNQVVIVYSPARIYAPQDCSGMFDPGYQLSSIDFTNFDTSKVTNMSSMFSCFAGDYYNGSTIVLDLSNFDTSNVTDMKYMFSYNYITHLDVSNFNTEKVINMSGMFKDSHSIKSLDLTSFDTSNVTNMGSMFYDCTKLTSIKATSGKWVIGSSCNIDYMFDGCGCSEVTLI